MKSYKYLWEGDLTPRARVPSVQVMDVIPVICARTSLSGTATKSASSGSAYLLKVPHSRTQTHWDPGHSLAPSHDNPSWFVHMLAWAPVPLPGFPTRSGISSPYDKRDPLNTMSYEWELPRATPPPWEFLTDRSARSPPATCGMFVER